MAAIYVRALAKVIGFAHNYPAARIFWSTSGVMAYIREACAHLIGSSVHMRLVCRAFSVFRQLLHLICTMRVIIEHVMVQPTRPTPKRSPQLWRRTRRSHMWGPACINMPRWSWSPGLLHEPYHQPLQNFWEDKIPSRSPFKDIITTYLTYTIYSFWLTTAHSLNLAPSISGLLLSLSLCF